MNKLLFALLCGFIAITLLITPKWLLRGKELDFVGSETKLEKVYITNNSLVGISSPYLLPLKTYGSLIDDLIQCESNGNPLAVGDNGRAKGILQFHEPTFKQYCVNKYGYSNDIWSEEIQINCANEMLEDNFNNVLHWTCYKLI